MLGSKNVLIVLAHPNTGKSFNHRLVKKAEELLISNGHKVRVVDLYQINFNPVGGPDDFKNLNCKESFDYQAEQKISNEKYRGTNFCNELQQQMENVKWADVLFFQFPFYWFTIPAILKGWVDRVFSYYFAYGGDASLKGKKWITSVTTGGPLDMYKKGVPIEEHLKHFHTQTAAVVQAETLPIYISYGINFLNAEQKGEAVEEFAKFIRKYF